MDNESTKAEKGSVTFESDNVELGTLAGIAPHVLGSPEKLRQLMELLELPEGTKAHVNITSSALIIR